MEYGRKQKSRFNAYLAGGIPFLRPFFDKYIPMLLIKEPRYTLKRLLNITRQGNIYSLIIYYFFIVSTSINSVQYCPMFFVWVPIKQGSNQNGEECRCLPRYLWFHALQGANPRIPTKLGYHIGKTQKEKPLVFYAKGFWGMHEESASVGETDQGGTWWPNVTKKRATYKIALKQGDALN